MLASNTYAPLTTAAPGFAENEPDCYFPTGARNFVRLFPSDYHQAAAIPQLLVDLECAHVLIMYEGTPYGLAVAEALARAAPAAGMEVVGFGEWDPDGTDSDEILYRGGSSEALVLCGIPSPRARELIRRKVSLMGPNDCSVGLVASDAFLNRDFLTENGELTEHMLVCTPGLRPGSFPAAGEAFVSAFSRRFGIARESVEPYTVHAAQAAVLLLRAIGQLQRIAC